ncbi:CCAAT displacement transcription factor COY1 TDEL_0G02010 [Torulaspora delbrueckii]|uniref:Protein CASP n=1 Tax=Torulaspora delbrueckii TaxID=4950 RepID=G8ZYU3_TORDE|nr:hypothetical protein TDEL_0G02010 [Torulaspora delbrueckii]CCE93568.1 hypothetical protein TDEL_0G02010 [Torulaspora delbrueckii]
MDLSVYEHALELWSKADLTTLQKQLDKDVIDMKEKETQFLDSRKNLASETKIFKKLASEEKLANVNKIIKHYQQEIDSLTKRSKSSEVILLDLYGKLAEAPDPKPLLQNSLQKLGKTDDSKALREQIELLEDKLAKYADYENLKSRLLDLEQNSAVTLVKRLTAKEQEVNSRWEEKQRNWEERESKLMSQLEKLEKGVSNEGKDQTSGNVTEHNLLEQELETAQSRNFELEKRNEELNVALTKATSNAEQELQLQSRDTKIKQLESENALLSATSEHEHQSHKKIEKQLTEQLAALQAETDSYKSEIKSIRMKLDNYSDYVQLKEELSALKRIEFGTDQDDEENGDDNAQNKVESGIISANKKLQSNLAELRGKLADREEENISLQKQLVELKERVTKTEALNQKLEEDLDKVEEVDQKFNDTASMMSGATRQINNRSGRLSPTSSIAGIPEESEMPTNFGNNTILPIITKQRDRLRGRNTELEKQLRQLGTDKNKLKSEMTKLKTDNTKLYERIRYLSRYSGNTGDASVADVDTEAQYSQIYEDSINPLNTLKKKELEYYKRNRLSLWEKLFLSFARIILANKVTRMAFLLYCIGIHGLILMMSVYVINLSGYMTPEVGIVQSSTGSSRLVQNHNV